MHQNKLVCLLFIGFGFGSIAVFAGMSLEGRLTYDLDCSQFGNDYDVLSHFSFPIRINPMNNDWRMSTAVMDDNDTFLAADIYLENLQELRRLSVANSTIITMTERLGTLRKLNELVLINYSLTQSPNLRALSYLVLHQCA